MQRMYSVHWVGSLYIAMMSFLPKFIPVKISASFFVEIDEQIKQFLWKYKGPRIEQPNRSEKEEQSWRTNTVE